MVEASAIEIFLQMAGLQQNQVLYYVNVSINSCCASKYHINVSIKSCCRSRCYINVRVSSYCRSNHYINCSRRKLYINGSTNSCCQRSKCYIYTLINRCSAVEARTLINVSIIAIQIADIEAITVSINNQAAVEQVIYNCSDK